LRQQLAAYSIAGTYQELLFQAVLTDRLQQSHPSTLRRKHDYPIPYRRPRYLQSLLPAIETRAALPLTHTAERALRWHEDRVQDAAAEQPRARKPGCKVQYVLRRTTRCNLGYMLTCMCRGWQRDDTRSQQDAHHRRHGGGRPAFTTAGTEGGAARKLSGQCTHSHMGSIMRSCGLCGT
jgi:hypothetical protein